MSRNSAIVVLRTSGVPLYFFSILITVTGWILIGGVIAAIISFFQKDAIIFLGIVVKYNDLITIPLGIIIFVWMIYHFIFYLMANKIVMKDDELMINEYLMPIRNSKPSLKKYLIPKQRKIQIKLLNIKSITLGTGKKLEKLAKEKNDAFLEKEINIIKQEKLPVIGAEGISWLGRQFSPSMFITEKNEKKHFVSVKPFSKIGVLRLLNKLKERGIPVNIAI